MNTISISDLRKFKVEEIRELVPAVVTIEGTEAFVIGTFADTICLGDLHPRVRIQLKAQEQKARKGMPKGEKIWAPPRNPITPEEATESTD